MILLYYHIAFSKFCNVSNLYIYSHNEDFLPGGWQHSCERTAVSDEHVNIAIVTYRLCYAPPNHVVRQHSAVMQTARVRSTSSPTVHRSPIILKFVMKCKHPRVNKTSLPTMLLLTNRSEELTVERSYARNTCNRPPPMYTPQLYLTQFRHIGIS